jgi:hypothetical protein
MFVGIGFLSLLTASIASRFVKEERGEEHLEMLEVTRRRGLAHDAAKLRVLARAPDLPGKITGRERQSVLPEGRAARRREPPRQWRRGRS